MKKTVLLVMLTAISSLGLQAKVRNWPYGPDNPTYSMPEPAAVAEVAMVGVGLGLVAWRRLKKR